MDDSGTIFEGQSSSGTPDTIQLVNHKLVKWLGKTAGRTAFEVTIKFITEKAIRFIAENLGKFF